MITAAMVKELREMTGAGMMDCKKALTEMNGDMEKAREFLREKGLAGAEKKAGRIAAEGIVESYIHNGRIGVLIEVNSETDFVAKNDEFKAFVRDMAMQVAAAKPRYVTKDEVPQADIDHEREFLIHQAMMENAEKNIPEDKSRMIAEKKVEGRMEKFYEEYCLLDQPFIREPKKSVSDILTDLIAKIGENIKIRRFVRYEVGEGLEKREEDFAAEVSKQMGNK